MSRADKKGAGSPSSSKKNNFFSENFGQKKVTIRERRGGTAKDEEENKRRWKEEKRRSENENGNADAPKSYKPKREFNPDFKKPRRDGDGGEEKNYKPKREFNPDFKKPRRDGDGGEEKNYKPKREFNPDFKKPRRDGDSGEEKNYKPKREFNPENKRPRRDGEGFKGAGDFKSKRPYKKHHDDDHRPMSLRGPKKFTSRITEEMPLNKYIAHSGVCARREAAEMVKQGKVKVNGELILEPGYKVQPEDVITMAGKKLKPVKDLVYILLNKPKDFVTTTSDPEGRKTVMDLVLSSGVPRLYPVGRLDRNTTGVLLLTNDGDLAQKLAHPKYNVKKIYQVTLDKPVTKEHLAQLKDGVMLDDGMAQADAVSFLTSAHEVGIEIHSGRNRIVRRMFEALGYDVEKLDRVMYAGLTKKNVSRGQWRFLNEKEIVFLKHFK